ncbi:Membrane protein BRI3 [Caenorhabditis elegans]|uniref:Membrane protein BRI3 n=1 Tax=Caenorhabditis elegans TaxID=6239 RepID=P91245_CAEEL|nr:Membrane protein BRI3 [Caenorhabditis elegans]CCD69258.1 Membrane protein BRI3 [Caenorhabditis elegans]|eukprot:NP_494874.1 Uncharacterized protein CELE_F11G11.5 [Caenorhabditis elegans]
MTGHQDPVKQPLPDSPPTDEGMSSSSAQPSAPSAPEQQPTSPSRPPPPAGFVYPSTDIQNSSEVHVSAPVPAGPPPPHASAGPAPTMSSYDMPPPSYQAAMSYPAAPTYGGSTDPKYHNGGQPPIYYQPPQITQTRLPQPAAIEQIVRAVRIQNPAGSNVIVHVQPGAPCRRCTVGVITRQTDMCCLLCLIMLTIFTFPFGLIFLCCVPCTVQNRCTHCNRLA